MDSTTEEAKMDSNLVSIGVSLSGSIAALTHLDGEQVFAP